MTRLVGREDRLCFLVRCRVYPPFLYASETGWAGERRPDWAAVVAL